MPIMVRADELFALKKVAEAARWLMSENDCPAPPQDPRCLHCDHLRKALADLAAIDADEAE